jgi:hypothetical protein
MSNSIYVKKCSHKSFNKLYLAVHKGGLPRTGFYTAGRPRAVLIVIYVFHGPCVYSTIDIYGCKTNELRDSDCKGSYSDRPDIWVN